MTIEDDGQGTAGDSTVAQGSGLGSGLGLVGMRERAMALGGQLDVVRSDRGFKLQAIIPLGPLEAAEAQ